MKEMKKTAQILDKVFRVLEIMLKIALIACLVSLGILTAGLIFKLDPNQIGTFSQTVELGAFELRLAEMYTHDRRAILFSAGVEVVMSLLYIWAGRIAVRCVREILAPMTQGEPFGGIVSEKLKQLSSLSLLLGIMVHFADFLGRIMMDAALDIQSLLLSEKVTAVTFNFEPDLTFLLVFAALRLLSYVFRYGEELQKLSDETL